MDTGLTDRTPKPGKKYFDLDEANKSLSYVSRVVQDLMAGYMNLIKIRRRIEMIPYFGGKEKYLKAKYNTALENLRNLVDELHKVGVELRDFERGMVDF